MTEFAATFSSVLAGASLLAFIAAFVVLVAEVLPLRYTGFPSSRLLGKNIYAIGLIVSLGLSTATLIYSEVIGFPPCQLCWYARIALYPQVILFAVGIWRPARELLISAGILSGLGLFVTLYNAYIQVAGSNSLLCLEGAESCATIYVREFGFVTIPVMAVIGFIFLFVLTVSAYREQGRTK